MSTHPSHTAMLEGRLLTMRQEVRRAVSEARKAIDELDRADAEIARCLIGIRAIEGDMRAMGRRAVDQSATYDPNGNGTFMDLGWPI